MNRGKIFDNLKGGLSRGFASASNFAQKLPGLARGALQTVDNTAKTLGGIANTANRVYNVAKSSNLVPNEAKSVLDAGFKTSNEYVDRLSDVNKNLQNFGRQVL
jgi:methyl-accepting chemotaxis protein